MEATFPVFRWVQGRVRLRYPLRTEHETLFLIAPLSYFNGSGLLVPHVTSTAALPFYQVIVSVASPMIVIESATMFHVEHSWGRLGLTNNHALCIRATP